MTTLFISHSSKDKAWAERVHQVLFDSDYQCLFLDSHPDDGIHAGADWERTLYQRLRQSRGVIVLCSANWLASPWCVAEAMMARERKRRVFLLATADAIDGRQVKGLEDTTLQIPDFLKDRQFVSLAGVSEKAAYQLLLQGLEKEGLKKYDFKPPERPYPGLEPFQETDAAVFFGRDDESDQVIDVLHKRRKGDANGFVLVLGASGCGKSSLVRAGVLPQLKHASKDDGARAAWVVVPPFLGGKGVEGLALSLAQAFKDAGQPRELATVRGRLATASDVRALGGELLLAHSAPNGCVLLVLDQLEEVFGTPEASEARAALGLLLDASADASGSVVILATLRSDFLNAFQLFEGAAKRYEEVTLDPMLRSHFSEVIEGPADRFGLELDAGLSERMVEETAYNDALPLLAFTLEKLYEKCKAQGRLTLKAYGELGGVSAAIQHAANAILDEAGYAGLPADDPRMRDLRRAFCSLVQVGEEGQFTKRIARWSRMPASCEAILKRFVSQRLLVSDTANGEPVLSVAHEALFRVWDTLGGWLRQDQEFLRTRERIAAQARLWENEKRASDRLLPPGRPLAEGEDILASRRPELEPLLIEYIEASMAAARASERRRRRRTRTFMAAMAGVTLFAIGGGAIAWRQREQTINTTVGFVHDAVQISDKFGVSRSAIEVLLTRADKTFEQLMEIGVTPRLRSERAWELIASADNYGIIGKSEQQLDAAKRARDILEELVSDHPSNPEWRQQLAISHDLVGEILANQMRLDAALAEYHAAQSIREKLSKDAPSDPKLRRDLSISQQQLGGILLRQGHLDEALTAFKKALEISEPLARDYTTNLDEQRDVLVIDHYIGDVLAKQGDLNGAGVVYETSLSIAKRLAADDPANVQRPLDILTSYRKLGTLREDQGDMDAALAAYQDSLSIAKRLAADDPAEVPIQRDLSLGYENVGRILLKQRRIDAGLNAYRASLAIAERLAAADPADASLQQDLSIRLIKSGDALKEQGDLQAALDHYRRSLEIAKQLAADNPSNTELQRGVLEGYDRIGELLNKRGQVQEAIAAYQASHVIAERLAAAEPTNADWQYLSRRQLGRVRELDRNKEEAQDMYCQAKKVVMTNSKLHPSESRWQDRLHWLEQHLNEAQGSGACPF
jgi:tetratricopeptide (TPR) repeat protein